MKLKLTAKEINLKGKEGNYSYRINNNVLVEGIPTIKLALESAEANYAIILKNRMR